MLRRSRFNIREGPEPDDLLDLEVERAFANAVIVERMKRNPERAREVLAHVARSVAESGRYSAEAVNAALTSFWASWKRMARPRQQLSQRPGGASDEVSGHRRNGSF